MKKEMRKQGKVLAALVIFLGITYLPVFMNETILDAFAREDRIYEWLTSLYLFITSIIFVIAFVYSRKKSDRSKLSWIKLLSYIALAFLFFVAAGEEISWGERVFGFEQNYVKSINVQKEFNLHNLKYFQGEESVLPFSVDQFGIAFLLTFLFLIPLVSYCSRSVKEKVGRLIPIMPLSIGFLVPVNYLYQKFLMLFFPRFPELYLHPSMRYPQPIYEIREHGFAFAMFMSALFFIINLMKKFQKDDGNL